MAMGAQMSDSDEIRELLHTYEGSLNASDAVVAASCYARDGVFMPTGLPTAAGQNLREAYVQTFANVQLAVSFNIDELVVASDAVAYALTQSHGTQLVHATGAQTPEANREMFVFAREDDAWKIARYMFNKTA